MEEELKVRNGAVKRSMTRRYNVAPGQRVSVLVLGKNGVVMKEMRWACLESAL